MNKVLAIFLLLIASSLARPAQAQWVVTDPANLAQNVLTALRTLETVNNQIRQLQNEARNLESLDVNTLGRIRATLAETQRLFDEARGLAFDVTRTLDDFGRLYPSEYATAVTRARLIADRLERWTFSRYGVETAMTVQAQARQNFASDEDVLAHLVSSSQSAVGALQAAQATNQLLALQSRQLMQAQQLQIAADRAAALEQARTIAAEEYSRAMRRRFMTATTTYTPESVRGL